MPKIPVALQKEYMGVVWLILFAIIFIANILQPHWALKLMAAIAFSFGVIYIISSFKKTYIKKGDNKNGVRQQSGPGKKDE